MIAIIDAVLKVIVLGILVLVSVAFVSRPVHSFYLACTLLVARIFRKRGPPSKAMYAKNVFVIARRGESSTFKFEVWLPNALSIKRIICSESQSGAVTVTKLCTRHCNLTADDTPLDCSALHRLPLNTLPRAPDERVQQYYVVIEGRYNGFIPDTSVRGEPFPLTFTIFGKLPIAEPE